MLPLAERFTRYLLAVQCQYCSSDVYPHEDAAHELVGEWMQCEGASTIDDIRARVSRTCDGCDHMLDSD
jgi:hypothetical protein